MKRSVNFKSSENMVVEQGIAEVTFIRQLPTSVRCAKCTYINNSFKSDVYYLLSDLTKACNVSKSYFFNYLNSTNNNGHRYKSVYWLTFDEFKALLHEVLEQAFGLSTRRNRRPRQGHLNIYQLFDQIIKQGSMDAFITRMIQPFQPEESVSTMPAKKTTTKTRVCPFCHFPIVDETSHRICNIVKAVPSDEQMSEVLQSFSISQYKQLFSILSGIDLECISREMRLMKNTVSIDLCNDFGGCISMLYSRIIFKLKRCFDENNAFDANRSAMAIRYLICFYPDKTDELKSLMI